MTYVKPYQKCSNVETYVTMSSYLEPYQNVLPLKNLAELANRETLLLGVGV